MYLHLLMLDMYRQPIQTAAPTHLVAHGLEAKLADPHRHQRVDGRYHQVAHMRARHQLLHRLQTGSGGGACVCSGVGWGGEVIVSMSMCD